MQARWVPSLGGEDPLEKEMATHSSVLAWEISWTEKPGRLQSVGLHRVRQDWASKHTYDPELPSEGQLILRTLFGSHMSGKWAISWSHTWGSPGLLNSCSCSQLLLRNQGQHSFLGRVIASLIQICRYINQPCSFLWWGNISSGLWLWQTLLFITLNPRKTFITPVPCFKRNLQWLTKLLTLYHNHTIEKIQEKHTWKKYKKQNRKFK